MKKNMKKLFILGAAFMAATMFTACDDDTSTVTTNEVTLCSEQDATEAACHGKIEKESKDPCYIDKTDAAAPVCKAFDGNVSKFKPENCVSIEDETFCKAVPTCDYGADNKCVARPANSPVCAGVVGDGAVAQAFCDALDGCMFDATDKTCKEATSDIYTYKKLTFKGAAGADIMNVATILPKNLVVSGNGEHMYVFATMSGAAEQRLFYSGDKGATWEEVNNISPLVAADAGLNETGAANPESLFFGAFRSGLAKRQVIAFSAVTPANVVLIPTNDGVVFKSAADSTDFAIFSGKDINFLINSTNVGAGAGQNNYAANDADGIDDTHAIINLNVVKLGGGTDEYVVFQTHTGASRVIRLLKIGAALQGAANEVFKVRSLEGAVGTAIGQIGPYRFGNAENGDLLVANIADGIFHRFAHANLTLSASGTLAVAAATTNYDAPLFAPLDGFGWPRANRAINNGFFGSLTENNIEYIYVGGMAAGMATGGLVYRAAAIGTNNNTTVALSPVNTLVSKLGEVFGTRFLVEDSVVKPIEYNAATGVFAFVADDQIDIRFSISRIAKSLSHMMDDKSPAPFTAPSDSNLINIIELKDGEHLYVANGASGTEYIVQSKSVKGTLRNQ